MSHCNNACVVLHVMSVYFMRHYASVIVLNAAEFCQFRSFTFRI